MKKQIGIILIFGFCLIMIPCITFINGKPDSAKVLGSGSVKILFTQTDTVEEISLEDYMIGAVLAQMPAEFEEEALKAQAVLAHTYILRRQLTENNSPDQKLNGADISDDNSLYQSYFTEEQAKDFYGDEYDTAYEKVSNAVRAAKNQILVYDSQPIIVAFHAISCGYTESAENLWGEDIPYLISVESKLDEELEGFEKTTELSLEELTARLEAAFPDGDFSGISDKLEATDTTDTGTVLTIEVGKVQLRGVDFAEALSLPSPCFSIETDGENYTFTTKGYGHLIGMSQYGANLMAQEGKDYQEILSRYITGTEIEKATSD